MSPGKSHPQRYAASRQRYGAPSLATVPGPGRDHGDPRRPCRDLARISTLAVDIYVGWLFLLSGIVGIASMFLAQNVQAFLWSLLTAALSLFVGIVLLWHPVEGAVSLTLVLIAFFIVEGVFQIVASLSYRDVFPGQWGWMLASGIVDLLLAGLIIKGWPSTAAWALG